MSNFTKEELGAIREGLELWIDYLQQAELPEEDADSALGKVVEMEKVNQ